MTYDQFNELVLQYQKPIISCIYKMVYSWEIARDIAQESFIKLWNIRNKLKSNKPVFTLLYRIAINLSIDHLRKQKNQFIKFSSPGLTTNHIEYEDLEFKEIVLNCCSELHPRQRAVFSLRDLEGFTVEEISTILKISAGNVRSNLHLARKKIKKALFEIYQIDQEYFNDM